jgi:hypothetical protein
VERNGAKKVLDTHTHKVLFHHLDEPLCLFTLQYGRVPVLARAEVGEELRELEEAWRGARAEGVAEEEARGEARVEPGAEEGRVGGRAEEGHEVERALGRRGEKGRHGVREGRGRGEASGGGVNRGGHSLVTSR